MLRFHSVPNPSGQGPCLQSHLLKICIFTVGWFIAELGVFIAGHSSQGLCSWLSQGPWGRWVLDPVGSDIPFCSFSPFLIFSPLGTFHLMMSVMLTIFVLILTFQVASFSLRPGQVKRGLSGVVRPLIRPETKLLMGRKAVGIPHDV